MIFHYSVCSLNEPLHIECRPNIGPLYCYIMWMICADLNYLFISVLWVTKSFDSFLWLNEAKAPHFRVHWVFFFVKRTFQEVKLHIKLFKHMSSILYWTVCILFQCQLRRQSECIRDVTSKINDDGLLNNCKPTKKRLFSFNKKWRVDIILIFVRCSFDPNLNVRGREKRELLHPKSVQTTHAK